jgi:hypothetical protein
MTGMDTCFMPYFAGKYHRFRIASIFIKPCPDSYRDFAYFLIKQKARNIFIDHKISIVKLSMNYHIQHINAIYCHLV